MKRCYSIALAVFVILILFFFETVLAQTQRVSLSGNITAVDIRDVGTGYGPPSDFIDVEVIIKLDSQPGRAFGFQLRNDNSRPVRQAMYDLIRDAYRNNWRVTIDILQNPNKKNAVIYAIRVGS